MDVNSEEIVLRGHTAPVSACAWNPRLPLLGSGSSNVGIWTIPDPSRSILLTYDHSINHYKSFCDYESVIQWNETGSLLATGLYDGKVRIWTLQGQQRNLLAGHMSKIAALRWCDSNLLTGDDDGSVILWEGAKSSTDYKKYNDHSYGVTDIDFKDGWFATCSKDGSVVVREILKDDEPNILRGHQDQINSVRWSPSPADAFLASCSNDSTVKIWSSKQNNLIEDLLGHNDDVMVLRWSPRRPSILASASRRKVIFWDINSSEYVSSIGQWDWISSLEFSPNGNYIACGTKHGIFVWSVAEGKLVKSYLSGIGVASSVCWNMQGDMLAAGFRDHSVRVLHFRR